VTLPATRKFSNTTTILITFLGFISSVISIGYFFKDNILNDCEGNFSSAICALIDKEHSQESVKLKKITDQARLLSEEWQKIEKFTQPPSKSEEYIRVHADNILSLLKTIKFQLFTDIHWQSTIYYHSLIEVAIIATVIHEDAEYLIDFERYIFKLEEHLDANDHSPKDIDYLLKFNFRHYIKQHYLNSAVFRYWFGGQTTEQREEVLRRLKEFGGCDALVRNDVKFKLIYDATDCITKSTGKSL